MRMGELLLRQKGEDALLVRREKTVGLALGVRSKGEESPHLVSCAWLKFHSAGPPSCHFFWFVNGDVP